VVVADCTLIPSSTVPGRSSATRGPTREQPRRHARHC
jgi:hypothetical protein